MKRFRHFVRDRAANAAVEFAILLPVLLLIIIGAADFGSSVRTKLTVQAATNAGLQHAMATQGSNPDRTKAVINNLLQSTPATVTVERFCLCNATKIQCTASCASNKESYVSASVTANSQHLFWPNIGLNSGFRVYTGKVT